MGIRRYPHNLTTTELQWIINALNHDIDYTKREMDGASDGAPIQAFGEVIIDGRENLVRKLCDIVKSKTKVVGIY